MPPLRGGRLLQARGAFRRSPPGLGCAGLPSLAQPCAVLPADADRVMRHLEKAPPVIVSSLSNGFQVASCNQGGETATVGIWIDAGSRFESEETNGVAHFLEHLTFKGTTSRSKAQIENFFEHVGGHLNAYTTREQTVYYVKVFKDNLPEAMDVLTDILRRPRLDLGDIERERSTIMQEMEEVESNIDEVLMDHVHLTGFRDQGLGFTILGPADNIEKTIDRKMLRNFIDEHYTGPRMSLIACGAVEHQHMETLAKEMWGDVPTDPKKPELGANFFAGQKVVENTSIPSPHIAVAWPICGQDHQDMLTSQVLQNIVGQWERSSHDQNAFPAIHDFIQENCTGDDALATLESVQAFTTPYCDTGLFGIYVVATPSEAESARPEHYSKFAVRAFQTLIRTAAEVNEEQLSRAKETLKTSLLLNLDGSTALADELGKQMLAYGRWMPLSELFARIDAVEMADIHRVFQHYIHRKDFVFVGVGPNEVMPDHADIQAQMWAA